MSGCLYLVEFVGVPGVVLGRVVVVDVILTLEVNWGIS